MKLAREGYPVCVLCHTDDSSKMMERSFRKPNGVRFMGYQIAEKWLRGMAPSFLMFDEVESDVVRRLMDSVSRRGHVFAGAVRSSE